MTLMSSPDAGWIPAEDAPSGAAWAARWAGIRILYGPGSLAGLGEAARETGGGHVFLVTDRGVSAAGHVERALEALRGCADRVTVFDGVAENPTTRHVEAGVAAARSEGADLLVALGGGSAMDCAKGINFVLTNGGSMERFRGFGHARRPMLPSIGIPTTAGTGSDAQSYALIEQEATHVKMACGDRKARFGTVILDPDLTATCPRRVAATSGLDAISHAVESRVSRAGNPISHLLSREAWRLLSGAYAASLEADADAEVRGRMLLGAHLAGAAVEASMLGAAHACANPLTARAHALAETAAGSSADAGLAHGEAVLLMLPHVVRLNAPVAGEAYAGLLAEAAPEAGSSPARPESSAESLAASLEAMRARGGLPARLRDIGVGREELPGLAAAAAEQWTARFNPREVTRRDLEDLYAAAW